MSFVIPRLDCLSVLKKVPNKIIFFIEMDHLTLNCAAFHGVFRIACIDKINLICNKHNVAISILKCFVAKKISLVNN